MNEKIEKFFAKYSIRPDDIKYILREEGKTVVYLIDGRITKTYHPIKDFREALPNEDFLHPNKGILLAASQIIDVNEGHYEMVDGAKFKYRAHNSPLHDHRLLTLGRNFQRMQATADALSPEGLRSRFSLFDGMPLPAIVIESEFGKRGASIEFIIRYANQAMLDFLGLTHAQMINLPYDEVFGDHTNRWVVACADVAINGGVRLIDDYSKELDCFIKLHCYQPIEGFCACVLVDYPAPQE